MLSADIRNINSITIIRKHNSGIHQYVKHKVVLFPVYLNIYY